MLPLLCSKASTTLIATPCTRLSARLLLLGHSQGRLTDHRIPLPVQSREDRERDLDRPFLRDRGIKERCRPVPQQHLHEGVMPRTRDPATRAVHLQVSTTRELADVTH